MVRWPLQPVQPLQKTQLLPPFGSSVDSLCHPWVTTTNLSYRFPIFESSATALRGTTGTYVSNYTIHKHDIFCVSPSASARVERKLRAKQTVYVSPCLFHSIPTFSIYWYSCIYVSVYTYIIHIYIYMCVFIYVCICIFIIIYLLYYVMLCYFISYHIILYNIIFYYIILYIIYIYIILYIYYINNFLCTIAMNSHYQFYHISGTSSNQCALQTLGRSTKASAINLAASGSRDAGSTDSSKGASCHGEAAKDMEAEATRGYPAW